MELNGKWRDLDNEKEVNRQSENRERESVEGNVNWNKARKGKLKE